MRIRSTKPEFWTTGHAKALSNSPEKIGNRPVYWHDVDPQDDRRGAWSYLENIPRPFHCTLYRIYDSVGGLLYVGTAMYPNRRFVEHRRKREWWPEASRIELWLTRDTVEWDMGEWRDHRLREHTARAWESVCVMEQKPKYNLTSRG